MRFVMTGLSTPQNNIYLAGSLPALFAKTATPIIMVMGVNGLFTVVDAYFLGAYVGADALTAVTLMFPLYMLLVALATLVSNGFASIFARLVGGGDQHEARTVFAQAIQLALIVCMALIVLFLVFGNALSLMAANGDTALAGMGYTYISVLVLCSPLGFVLSINIAAMRSQGLLTAMTAIMLMSAFLNITFNYLFIVILGGGVAGSAWGTVLAEFCAILAVLLYWQRNLPQRRTPTRADRFGVEPLGRTARAGSTLKSGLYRAVALGGTDALLPATLGRRHLSRNRREPSASSPG
jgi:Na+-driven multidrug efflux pump